MEPEDQVLGADVFGTAPPNVVDPFQDDHVGRARLREHVSIEPRQRTRTRAE